MKPKITVFLTLCLIFSLTSNSQTIWTGSPVTITKGNNADWNLEANQDRITPTIWLTRKDNQGQFNIAQETGYSNGNGSPVDTEWGWGTTADIGSITFYTWKGATKDNNPYPPDFDHTTISGHPMVLHLITDNIYIDLTYNSWSDDNSGGGFSYTRSSDQGLSINDVEISDVKVYPIPSKDYLYIKNLEQNQIVLIYDLLGKKMLEDKFLLNKPIDITALENGIYFLKTEHEVLSRFIKN